MALGCLDQRRTAAQILAWFVGRWNSEVTFAEIWAHLGFETQRHWSRRAIGRLTPCLFGRFSLGVVLAKRLHPERLPCPQSRWYAQRAATFSDALAAVRRHRWGLEEYSGSVGTADVGIIPRAVLAGLQHVACYSR
jgi:hypothetical protein